MDMKPLLLLSLFGSLAFGAGAQKEHGFVAGSFVVTQKSLNEAPYRYAGVLRHALDRMETLEPPSKSDEEHCDVRYRIRPSGQRSRLQVRENSLSIRLQSNSSVVLSASLDVSVAVRTWIWKGIDLGFVGCLKVSSCNGQIVTYTAHIDLNVELTVLYVENGLRIQVRPVDTELNDVNVQGCRPPWYLWWFKKWQALLNHGVQSAFQEFADTYEHQSELPSMVSPLPNVFVHYVITDLVWKEEYVAVMANATFSAAVSSERNITFVPDYHVDESNQEAFNNSIGLPSLKTWPMSSPWDSSSHLLQGLRLSSQFVNGVLWFASKANLTQYHGSANVLDSQINGTIWYTPPEVRVDQADRLDIRIDRGLLMATCLPVANSSGKAATLFKAEFANVWGTGHINLAATEDQTGLKVSLDQMDVSRMNTKPFEPKLPLPESFENELMRNAIAHLQPMLNRYLDEKPINLPDNIKPFAAAPQLKLIGTGDGLGYAEILSYCTCSEKASKFAQCDPRSHICHPKTRRSDNFDEEEEENEDGGSSVLNKFKNKVEDGLKGILGVAHGVVSKFGSNNDSDNNVIHDDLNDLEDDDSLFDSSVANLKHELSAAARGERNITYEGVFLTVFESSNKCKLHKLGDTAKVYWLWRSDKCSPIFAEGKETNQFYRLGSHRLNLMCSDSNCVSCIHEGIEASNKDECFETNEASFLFRQPDLTQWTHERSTGNTSKSENVIGSVFFNDDFCSFLPAYLQPQLVSSHTNVGSINNNTECQETSDGDFITSSLNKSFVYSASWECGPYCTGCLFRVNEIQMQSCFSYELGVRLRFDNTIEEKESPKAVLTRVLFSSNTTVKILLVIILAIVLITGFVVSVLIFCRKNTKVEEMAPIKPKLRPWDLKKRLALIRPWLKSNVGWRLKTWKTLHAKDKMEDGIQNVFLVVNAVMAILFTYKWQGDNNPLLVIQDKLNRSSSWSRDLLDTQELIQFSSTLSLLTSLANIGNAVLSLLLFLLWLITNCGKRRLWIVLRLLSAVSLLAMLFVVLSGAIFSTYLDGLIKLRPSTGVLITDNASLHRAASSVLQVALSGFALTLVSFILVFLFHGVGGGLFCGSVLFRLLHLRSRLANLEVLTTLMVILTIIQPFVSLHPVIILAQDSNHNSLFLSLTILVWLLPLLVHSLAKLMPTSCSSNSDSCDQDVKEESSFCLSMFVALSQLALFITSFVVVTYSIVHTEFNQERQNLRDFVLPAIASVFVWTTSISYLLLALVMDESGTPERRLVFKDQDLDEARRLVRDALEKRLATLDARSSARYARVEMDDQNNRRRTMPASRLRPHRRAPPPPIKRDSLIEEQEEQRNRQALKHRIDQLHETIETRRSSLQMTSISTPKTGLDEKTPLKNCTKNNAIPDIDFVNEVGCCRRLWHFLVETKEYKDPVTYGWRIRYRRLFLTVGILVFCSLTVYTVADAQSFSSKTEIQKLLDYMHLNLTWPDSGSLLDDLFLRYNEMERLKSYIMLVSCAFFVSALLLDYSTQFTPSSVRRHWLFTGSRVATFSGSVIVFASVIVVGVPDYLAVSHLDTLSPFCGDEFNRTVKQVAEFAIGLFFACLFTVQLMPILITIAPALVRASVLILIHPSLQLVDESGLTLLRMSILQQVIQFSSLLAFPITFVSMAIVQQFQKDAIVSWLIVAFWLLPPLVLFIGLRVTRRLKRFTILLYVYYMYNCCYFLLLLALVLYALKLERALSILADLVVQPSFWASSLSQVFLCNVVISDLLYMTVF